MKDHVDIYQQMMLAEAEKPNEEFAPSQPLGGVQIVADETQLGDVDLTSIN